MRICQEIREKTKIRELIQHLGRRNRIPELLEFVRQERPNVTLSELSQDSIGKALEEQLRITEQAHPSAQKRNAPLLLWVAIFGGAGVIIVLVVIFGLTFPSLFGSRTKESQRIGISLDAGSYNSDSFDPKDAKVKSEVIYDYLLHLGYDPENFCTGTCFVRGDYKLQNLYSSLNDQGDLLLQTNADGTQYYRLDVGDSGNGKGWVQFWAECRCQYKED